MKPRFKAILLMFPLALFPLVTDAQQAGPIPVTEANYVEAEVDITFSAIVREVGSNKFRHDRTLIPLDKQPAVTMNRDTIYSFGIYHAPKGTRITLPKSKDDRYQSAMILQTDHYIDQVLYVPGTFEINSQTEFSGIAVRTQVDASDPEDVKYVNSLQDQIAVTLPPGVTPKEYRPRVWDMASLEKLRAGYQTEAKKLPNLNATSGAHGKIDPHLQRLGVSVALGLLPPEAAVYIYRDYGLEGDTCYEATYARPSFREKGFFSFTMYGADKYIHDECSTLNDRTIQYNPDGTFTLRYGPKGSPCENEPNFIPTPGDNWYLGMRIYRAGNSIINGEYELPVPTLVKAKPAALLDKKTVRDAYVYLMGRAFVIRQEQLDIIPGGLQYNEIRYNPVGKPLEWVNPNLDVTNNEAWIAVDDGTPAVLEIPKIEGRYYTAQILDEWGEVITNINERNYPQHSCGRYAFVAPGSSAKIPTDAVRIELRSPKAKLLARVELKTDPDNAVAMQKQFKLASLGKPRIAPPAAVPGFSNKDLIGVEIFDHADAILASAPDVSPVATQLQTQVRDLARKVKTPEARATVDKLLRETIIPGFQKYSVTEAGATKNNWIGTTVIGNYGDDFDIRAAANYIGIWANARHEVIYFVTTRDADGNPLNGGNTYVMDFPGPELPGNVVNAYWSLSLVDLPGFLAVANPLDLYTFNSIAPPPSEADGSLKIYLGPKSGTDVPEANWLPAPDGKPFSLTFRTYVPKDIVKRGEWFPPALKKMK